MLVINNTQTFLCNSQLELNGFNSNDTDNEIAFFNLIKNALRNYNIDNSCLQERIELLQSLNLRISKFNFTDYNTKNELMDNINKLIKKDEDINIKNQQKLLDMVVKYNESEKLKQLYAKAIEGNPMKCQDRGYFQAGAILSYLDDLKYYNKIYNSKKINKIINQLEFTFKISRTRDFTNDALKKEANLTLKYRILKLKEDGLLGDYLLMPCQYTRGDSGHGYLLKIEKSSQENCSMTIINTGEGAECSLFSEFKNIFSEREYVNYIKYSNIDFKYLTLDFISNIGFQEFAITELAPMKKMFQPIKDLQKRDSSIEKSFGRSHTAQVKGNCAFKSVSSFIRSELGKEEHKTFKRFVSVFERNKLANLEQNFSKNEMFRLATKTMQKRSLNLI